MEENLARAMMPIYSEEPIRVYSPKAQQKNTGRHRAPEPEKKYIGFRMPSIKEFKKRYGIVLILALAFTLYTILLSSSVKTRTEKRVWAEAETQYAAKLEQYKQEQAYQAQAEHWLSGDASREAFINQEVDAVAPVIAKLATDPQKLTEACCMLARVMSPSYPNTFQEVAKQAKQWMFYDASGDNTFTQHDRDLAESIVRPYLESQIIPNGLTKDMVYGSWSTNDFVLRDSYETNGTMHTFRYSG